MTMADSSTPSPSPRRSPRLYQQYLKPGALAKLRDSKITNRRRKIMQNSLSDQLLLFTPTSSSPTQQQDQPFINQENGIPCFDPPLYLNRPNCLTRKKLFAVNPTFTNTDDTYRF
ncbi:hypothetical protein Fmac_031645 [Flemingia macrophylla]|uniref:Uncharacterized protein n=1 Tax=Flemingia macrophylla TaxID=520843 RepID=A0ABD1L2N1_9FABA